MALSSGRLGLPHTMAAVSKTACKAFFTTYSFLLFILEFLAIDPRFIMSPNGITHLSSVGTALGGFNRKLLG